jgi:hypothetical protein
MNGSGRISAAFRRHSPAPSRCSVAGPAAVLPMAVLLTSLLGACGGSKSGAEDASDAFEPKSEIPWKDKTREQRMEWMGFAVFPKMRQLFLAQDNEKYRDFACQTCHGETMEMIDFKMPNDLFALSAADPLAQARTYDEKTTDFMLGGVVPEMAKLLGLEAFTQEKQTGFGCAGCHPANKE